MQCDDVRALLDDDAARTSPREIPDVETHLHHCPDCQDFVLDLELSERAFRAVAFSAFPPERSRELCAKIIQFPRVR